MPERGQPSIKLGILTSYYQDMRCLDKMLHSLHNFPLNTPDWFQLCAILYDGRYRGYKSSEYRGAISSGIVQDMIYDHFAGMCNEFGNDKTQRFSYVHRIPAVSDGSIPEKQKRQTLMNMAATADCDFALVLDSDEYLDNERRHGAEMWRYLVNELRFIKYQHPTKYHIYGVKFYDNPRYKKDGYAKFIGNTSHRPRLFFRPEHIRYTTNHYTFNFYDEPKLNLVSPVAIYHRPSECRGPLRMTDSDLYKQKLPWLE